MRLRTKLLLVNSVVIVVMTYALGIYFYQYSRNRLQAHALAYLETIATHLSEALDSIFRQMDFVSMYVVSNQGFLPSATVLSVLELEDPVNLGTLNASRQTIQSILRNYAILSNFYSISFISVQQEMLTSNFFVSPLVDVGLALQQSTWYGPAQHLRAGQVLVVAPHLAIWNTRGDVAVFGMVRVIYGPRGRIGYLEVSKPLQQLNQLFALDYLVGAYARVALPTGEHFYTNAIQPLRENTSTSVQVVSPDTGMSVTIAQSQEAILEPLGATFGMIMWVSTLIILLAITFMFELSRRSIESHENEVQRGQLQSHFDALQAQVNPHFINNLLTVISARGYETGHRDISEMCETMSTMLHYSTHVQQKMATIAEEIAYTQSYLFLMKKRFERKLSYHIHVADDLLAQPLPKMVIQPLVENALTHGFKHTARGMVIDIQVYASADRYHIDVADNGVGFTADKRSEILAQVAAIRENPLAAQLRIGGLGMLNTAARLALSEQADMVFEIVDTPSTIVRLGGRRR